MPVVWDPGRSGTAILGCTGLRQTAFHLLIVLVLVSHHVHAGRGISAQTRENAFVGYSEGPGCQDAASSECAALAVDNGCLYNPFTIRNFCPIACDVLRCASRGTKQVFNKGRATTDGTKAYVQLMATQLQLPQSFYNLVQMFISDDQLHLSNLGMGTYLGEADAATDEAVVQAALYSITHGWNVLDTASNYRGGRSEVALGEALTQLLAGQEANSFSAGTISAATAISLGQQRVGKQPLQSLLAQLGAQPQELAALQAAVAATTVHKGEDIMRDMLFVSTKAGFTTPELVKQLTQDGAMSSSDVVHGMHSMHPSYLWASLDLSLQRLKLQTVDLFYLHNVAEMQLPAVGRGVFMGRLAEAFRMCEAARLQGDIVYYGLATWDCFRVPPEHPSYLSLEQVVLLATSIGGAQHGFRFIQLPVNARMNTAWVKPWQTLTGPTVSTLSAAASANDTADGSSKDVGPRNVTLLQAADELQIGVFTSAPFGEGELLHQLAPALDQVLQLSAQQSTAAKLLQHARSTPNIVSTLVGHKTRANVESNLQMSYQPLLTEQELMAAQRAIVAASRTEA